MKIRELAYLIPNARIVEEDTTEVLDIAIDSRKVMTGDLFVCVPGVPGFMEDRHQYAEHAVQRGATALVAERELPVSVPQIIVKDSRFALALFSCHINGYPSNKLKLIGVTGTNGKTTTAHLIEHILRSHRYRTGIMGNFGCRIGDQLIGSDNNTQEPPDLQRNLNKMTFVQTDYAVMEVSSQGLDMGRVIGCNFQTAVFTNLTQDHLNYHGSMDKYREAKGLLFSRLGNGFAGSPSRPKLAVLNADDPASGYFRKITSAAVLSYGIQQQFADVRATNMKLTAQGTMFDVDSFAGHETFQINLLGMFNVYNALAAITVALAEGLTLPEVKEYLSTFLSVRGRMELVNEGQDFVVLVDYAHTPDGLENALKTVKRFATGRVITVFGCGGERDVTKRPIMGSISAKYSDFIILTSDNPRTEDPEKILDDIKHGIESVGFSANQFSLVPDRKQAIELAIECAQPNDVVLIAGKGHETYQILSDGTVHFDDVEITRESLSSRRSVQ